MAVGSRTLFRAPTCCVGLHLGGIAEILAEATVCRRIRNQARVGRASGRLRLWTAAPLDGCASGRGRVRYRAVIGHDAERAGGARLAKCHCARGTRVDPRPPPRSVLDKASRRCAASQSAPASALPRPGRYARPWRGPGAARATRPRLERGELRAFRSSSPVSSGVNCALPIFMSRPGPRAQRAARFPSSSLASTRLVSSDDAHTLDEPTIASVAGSGSQLTPHNGPLRDEYPTVAARTAFRGAHAHCAGTCRPPHAHEAIAHST